MSYIGQRPVVGRYIKLDQISSGFNGSNTGFSMTAGSQAVFPGTARNLLLSLGGVIQEPDTDFTISGSTLTFTTPPVANTTFFGVIYGDMQATGTPSDGTVLPASIASSGHFKIPQLTVNEDGADVDFRVEGDTEANLLFVDASTDRVGIGTSSPDGLLHVLSGSAGSITAATDANDLVLEASTNVGISLLTANDSQARIKFGDPDANNAGSLIYNHQNDKLSIVTATGNRMIIGSDMISARTSYGILRTAGGYTFRETNEGNERAGIHSDSSNNLIFKTASAAEKMRIQANGLIGIGTTSPSAALELIASTTGRSYSVSSATEFVVERNGNSQISIIAANDSDSIIHFADTDDENIGLIGYDHANNSMRFRTNDSVHMTLDSSGKVGIGTTSPSEELTISSATPAVKLEDTDQANSYVQFSAANGDLFLSANGASSQGQFILRSGNGGSFTERMRIDSSGNIGIGTSSPKGLLHSHISAGARNDYSTAADGFIIEKGGNTGLSIDPGSSGTANIYFPNESNHSIASISHNNSTGEFRLRGEDHIILATNANTERMRIKSDGDVLLTRATAGGGGNETLLISANYGSGSDQALQASNSLRFYSNGANERMRIASDGTIGVGTTSPESKFAIKGSSGSGDLFSISDITVPTSGDEYGVAMIKSNAAAYMLSITAYNSNGKGLRVYNNGGSTGRTSFEIAHAAGTKFLVDGNGNVGIGNGTPSSFHSSANNLVVGSGSGEEGITISSGNGSNGVINFADSTSGSDSYEGRIIYSHSSNHMTFNVNDGSERMRIDSSGRILIGTNSPTVSKLFINGGSVSVVGSDSDFGGGGNRVFLDHDNNDVRFGFTGGGGSATNRGIRFHHCPNSTGTANTNRITEIGEFKIGHDGNADASTSTDKVHSIGGCNTDSVISNLARLCMQERSGNWISFKDGGGTHYGTISRSGSGVTYGSNSDYRLKDNVANLTGGIALVKQLRPVTFNWNELSGLSKTETHQGFIAHEVQALVSDAVEGEKDGMDIWGDCTDSKGNVTQLHVPESKKKEGETWTKKGEDIHDQQLDTGKLIPILTAALQEAVTEIETLKTKVAALEAA